MSEQIRFPNLGIVLSHVGRSFRVFGFEIAYYGVVVSLAMAAGIAMAMRVARKTGQDADLYFDFAIGAVLLSLLGARAYYVVFSWEYYKLHPLEILDFRGGGLAIYGGVITGILFALWYARHRQVPVLRFLDTGATGLILGQAIGRWGNFFNREAFGGYTDTLFAMQIPQAACAGQTITPAMAKHVQEIDGVSFVQVHPTFLYESVWNLAVLALLLAVTFHGRKRRAGQVFWLYLLCYGVGRFWIEGLRTDQLLLPGTQIAVSQVVSAAAVAFSLVMLVRSGEAGHRRRKRRRNP